MPSTRFSFDYDRVFDVLYVKVVGQEVVNTFEVGEALFASENEDGAIVGFIVMDYADRSDLDLGRYSETFRAIPWDMLSGVLADDDTVEYLALPQASKRPRASGGAARCGRAMPQSAAVPIDYVAATRAAYEREWRGPAGGDHGQAELRAA